MEVITRIHEIKLNDKAFNNKLCGTANSLEEKLERIRTFYTPEPKKNMEYLQ